MRDGHKSHDKHDHQHGPNCGHETIDHEARKDYLHDGHMRHAHGDHVDCHNLPVGGANPADCTPAHACGRHDKAHQHGKDCGHGAVAHGDHTDDVVDGHLRPLRRSRPGKSRPINRDARDYFRPRRSMPTVEAR